VLAAHVHFNFITHSHILQYSEMGVTVSGNNNITLLARHRASLQVSWALSQRLRGRPLYDIKCGPLPGEGQAKQVRAVFEATIADGRQRRRIDFDFSGAWKKKWIHGEAPLR